MPKDFDRAEAIEQQARELVEEYTKDDLEAEVRATRTRLRWAKEREDHLEYENQELRKLNASQAEEIKKLRFYVGGYMEAENE